MLTTYLLSFLSLLIILSSISAITQQADPVAETLILPFSLSLVYISNLARWEAQIYANLKAVNTTTQLPLVGDYIKDYEECNGNLQGWRVEHHPLLIYRIVWRFVTFVSQFMQNLPEQGFENIRSLLHMTETLIEFPSQNNEALDRAVEAILDLQNKIRLSPPELGRGKFGDFETKIGLSTFQATEFARISAELNYFVEAWEWLDHLENEPSVDLDEIRRIRQSIIAEHDENHVRKAAEDDLHIFEKPLKTGKSGWRKDSEMKQWLTIGKDSGHPAEGFFRTYALCRNLSILKSNVPSSHLKCWMDGSNPYFTLSPIKTELLFDHPKIQMFHDIVGGKVMEDMWSLSSEGMEHDAKFELGTNAQAVLGNIHWMYEGNFEHFDHLMTNLEEITGLNMSRNATYNIRVSQYVMSGDVGVHHDAYKPGVARDQIRPTFGDVQATVLIYMNNVILGGEIVFPMLDLVIKPVQGSVLVWDNYKRNGNMDWQTRHALCPPILGQKRIATILVKQTQNRATRPCSLFEHD